MHQVNDLDFLYFLNSKESHILHRSTYETVTEERVRRGAGWKQRSTPRKRRLGVGCWHFRDRHTPSIARRRALLPVRASRIDCAMFPRSARSHCSGRYRLLTRAGRRDPPGWEHDEHRSRVPVAAETAPAHWSIPNLKARHRATPRRRPSVYLAADRRVANRSATGLVLRVRTRARRTLHLDVTLLPPWK